VVYNICSQFVVQGEATRSVYLKKPPDLPADGESEETPAVTSQIVSEHGDAAEDTAREVSCTKPVTDSCDEPHGIIIIIIILVCWYDVWRKVFYY